MTKMGRPRKEIDYAQFERLCKLQCTLAEISAVFDMSEDTLETRCTEHYGRTFSEVFKQYSADGKISLRRTQFRMAERNPGMAIWLGKQYLGQRDRADQHIVQDVTLQIDHDEAARKNRERMLMELDEQAPQPAITN